MKNDMVTCSINDIGGGEMKTFLICNTSFFGDTILTNALVRNIKEQYKDSRIVFIVNKPFYEVACFMDGVDEVWAYDKNGANKGIVGLYRFYMEHKNKYEFDAAFVIYGNERNIILSKLLGCKYVYADNKGVLNLFLHNSDVLYGNKEHAQDRFATLLELYSNKPIKELKIKYNPPVESYEFVRTMQRQNQILNLNDIIVINPTSKSRERDLRLDTCVDLIKKLNEMGKIPAIIGAGTVALKYIKKLKEVNCSNFIDLVDKTTFSQLGALLQGSGALISVDTGTLHFALALDIPVVAIFYINTESKLKRWAPKTIYKHKLIAGEDYSAQNIIENLYDLIGGKDD